MRRRIAFGITTGGLLAGGGFGFAHADTAGPDSGTAGQTAGGSPGILSGNSVQIPVDIPINVCGVTANVVGLLNPAAHNACENSGGATATGGATTATTGDSDTAPAAAGGAHGSPGVLSGNNVQAPVHVPLNVCGDTVNVVGIGNAAAHNTCANHGGATATGGSGTGTTAGGSPGILSGNSIQIPIDIPVNVCGNSVNVVGVGNAAVHNHCENHGGAIAGPPSAPPSIPPIGQPPTIVPGTHVTLPGTPRSIGGETPPAGATGTLAHTGSDALMLAPIGAALIGGGAFLYRRFRPDGSF